MLLADLQAASFRGAPFLVPSDDTQEGRNAIKHRYPDASFLYAEDNGLLPPEFKLTAILHGKGLPGKLSRLRRALNQPGPGVLKHPHYGTQFVQVDGKYIVKRSDKESGVVTLIIKFVVTGPPRNPGTVSGVAAYVTGLAGTAITQLFEAFQKEFGAPKSRVSTQEINDVLSYIAGELLTFGSATNAPSGMLARSDFYIRNTDQLVPLLVQSYRDPFEDRTISTAKLVDGFSSIADAGTTIFVDASGIIPSTTDLQSRKTTIEAFGKYTEAAALASIADAMAARDYTTANEVESDEDRLTDLFETTQERELPTDIHRQLMEIYVATSEILRDVAVRLPRVTEIDIGPIPASALAYQLYENNGMTNGLVESRVQTLVDLNLSQDPSFLTTNATVLVEAD